MRREIKNLTFVVHFLCTLRKIKSPLITYSLQASLLQNTSSHGGPDKTWWSFPQDLQTPIKAFFLMYWEHLTLPLVTYLIIYGVTDLRLCTNSLKNPHAQLILPFLLFF